MGFRYVSSDTWRPSAEELELLQKSYSCKIFDRVPMAKRIQSLVYNADVSVTTLGNLMSIDRRMLYNYMDGTTLPSAEILFKFSTMFNVTIDWLVKGE